MIKKNLRKSFIISSSLVFSIFLLDRLSKLYVIFFDQKIFDNEIFTSKFLNIQLVWNDGIAFGLLSFSQEKSYNLLTIFISLVVIFIFYLVVKTKGLKNYALLMILGGALGNLFDRLYYKAVPDFIDVHFENFHWFIFNVADIFITIGVIFVIFLEIIDNNKEKL
tara:strand:+ start:20 stop:514 length:495 start_codon:yes stop_codon:yes gene_type:complete